jgi:glycosyltransferase involved in cell wall biosynthesis
MSAGVPVVASKVGGIPEIVTNGEDGILVANRPQEIEAAIAKIQANADFYGQHARQKIIDRFQESHMVTGTLNVYRKMLAHV